MSDMQQFSAGDALGKAKDYAEGHGDQVSGVIDKAQEAISNATGGKFDGAIEKGADMLEDKLGIDQGQEQSGSAPQEGVEQTDAEACGPTDTAPPVEPTDPTQDPATNPGDPSSPADPSAPSEPSIPTEPGTEGGESTEDPAAPPVAPTEPGSWETPSEGTDQPTVQPSGEPGTSIPAEPGAEPAAEPGTEPGYGGESAQPEFGEQAGTEGEQQPEQQY